MKQTRCKKCGGPGLILVKSSGLGYEPITCPTCHGTGKVKEVKGKKK